MKLNTFLFTILSLILSVFLFLLFASSHLLLNEDNWIQGIKESHFTDVWINATLREYENGKEIFHKDPIRTELQETYSALTLKKERLEDELREITDFDKKKDLLKEIRQLENSPLDRNLVKKRTEATKNKLDHIKKKNRKNRFAIRRLKRALNETEEERKDIFNALNEREETLREEIRRKENSQTKLLLEDLRKINPVLSQYFHNYITEKSLRPLLKRFFSFLKKDHSFKNPSDFPALSFSITFTNEENTRKHFFADTVPEMIRNYPEPLNRRDDLASFFEKSDNRFLERLASRFFLDNYNIEIKRGEIFFAPETPQGTDAVLYTFLLKTISLIYHNRFIILFLSILFFLIPFSFRSYILKIFIMSGVFSGLCIAFFPNILPAGALWEQTNTFNRILTNIAASFMKTPLIISLIFFLLSLIYFVIKVLKNKKHQENDSKDVLPQGKKDHPEIQTQSDTTDEPILDRDPLSSSEKEINQDDMKPE